MVDNNNIENQRSVRELLSIVFKHKGKILTMFLTVVLTATVLSVLKEPKYEAASKLLLKYGRENIYKSTSPSGEMVIDSSREERLNSEVEMLKGLNLAAEVLKDIGVQAVYPKLLEKPLASSQSASKLSPLDKAIPAFEKSLTVEAIPKSNIIEIRFQHEDPVIAAQIVNKLVDVYLEHHINVFKDSGDYVFFDEQVKLYQKKLKDSEEELNQFKSINNIFELQEQKKVLLNQISQLEIELAKTRGELNENSGKIRALNASGGATSGSVSLGQETDFNPFSISTLRNKLADLKMQEEKLLTNYNETALR